jgi:hypothetical protein
MSSDADNQQQGTRPFAGAFPRIELPPVPSLGRPDPYAPADATAPAAPRVPQFDPMASAPAEPPVQEREPLVVMVPVEPAPPTPQQPVAPATDLRGLPVGGFDEPPAAWQSPFPAPEVPRDGNWFVPGPQVAPAPAGTPAIPAPARAITQAPDTAVQMSAPMTIPTPTQPPTRMPMPSPAPQLEAPANPDEGFAPASPVARFLFLALAAALVWASQMAFSAALLALAAMLVSEVAMAIAAGRAPAAPRSSWVPLFAVVSTLASLVAAYRAFGQFGEMAFVAGLFVLVAVVPSIIVLAIAGLLARRHGTSGDQAIRSGTLLRFGVLAALMVAGYQAFQTFSAKPDAIVTFVIVALTFHNVHAATRRSGRAAG